MKYRPEVDGLRAVAVIPVILFHASPTLLSGGFLGVDVFFVISGFLITALLLEDMAAGTYTLARFYERRVRRILPALLVMVVVTVVLAWALMLPRGFGNTARSAAAAAAFLSNVFFWQTTDYFDIDALAQPLLHCWSLAVEEQFYILFPVVLALAWRRVSVRVLVLGLIGLTLASLALAHWGSAVHPKVNYYFTFSRFWELFLGSLGAFALRYRQMRARPVLAGIGLAAVIVSMVLFRPATPHPGPWTLIPVLGTLMVLLWADADRGVGRLLAMGPVVAVGKISYSLYLWHYPIFSFAAAQGPVSDEVWNVVAQIAVVFAVSVASWRFVETPFRHRRAGQGPARALWIGAGAVAAVIALGQVLGRFPDVTLRYLTATPEARQMLMFAETYGRGPKEKASPTLCFFSTVESLEGMARCIPQARPNLVLWGDSHAAALATGFEAAGFATGLFGGPGCGPLINEGWALSAECANQNRHVMQALRDNPPDVLVLHAYWRNKRDLMVLLPQTIRVLRRDLPQTRLVVLGGVPYWIPSLPERIVAAGAMGRHDAMVAAQLDGVDKADDKLALLLGDLIAAGEVSLVRLTGILCRDGACRAFAGTTPFAYDYGHLTREGAAELVRDLLASAPHLWAAARP